MNMLYDKIKDFLGIKEKPAFYIIEFFSQEIVPILMKNFNKLPKQFKAKILRELPEKDLKEWSLSKYQF
jgi:hypothetical protein